MRLGKLDNDTLERLVLAKFRRVRPEACSAPEIGEDCATVNLFGDLAVLSTDPITSAKIAQLGRLTVHVCCNDAAAAGAEPVGLLITLLAPPGATEAEIGRIADDLAAAAAEAGVDILGGHTEVTDSVTRFVTCAAVLARLSPSAALRGMRAGDDIVLTKYAGLEGTAILASDFATRLSALPAETLASARALAARLSVVPESRVAMLSGATAMHDVTEGGVLGALWELCRLHGCGAALDTSAIPVLPETQAICQALGLDPLRLIGSGSLLIACENGARLVAALREAGIPAAQIARAAGDALVFPDGTPVAPPQADELYRVFPSLAPEDHI